MKNYLSTHLLIAGNALAIAVIICGAAWFISESKKETRTLLENSIEHDVKTITALAELTDRNGADEITATIISDCPRRAEFENKLGTLNAATKKELVIVQQLFESCGAFYAERKALMVSRLEREYKSLSGELVLLSTLRDLTPQEQLFKKWNELIEFEKTRSALLREQTDIQEKIITLLISGVDTRTQITQLVQDAQSVNQSLSVTDTQIDELRVSLMQ